MGLEDQLGEALEGGVRYHLEGPEDQLGEALVGGVRYHLEGLEDQVALALVLGGLDFRVALALVLGALVRIGGLDLVASSDPASIFSAVAACSKTAAALSSDTRAQAVHHPISDSMPSRGPSLR
ncbi:hypothetical protein D1007_41532 [Hordeum vulgare]|nr:hypothetical protein D1007_41532 [Hordeum vulgare]